MTDGHLYRHDHLNCLRGQASDPWLRAKRIRMQPESFPHHQIGQALSQLQDGQGVFRLSMWRDLESALTDLRNQLRMAGSGYQPPDAPLVLQRIRADHPMFKAYARGDDEHLSGQAWLFWNTESCTDDQDWSTGGISHDDIEALDAIGNWVPFHAWVGSAHRPPPLDPGWTRIELSPAERSGPPRYLEARWVDFPSAEGGSVPGIFARVPMWSAPLWPADWTTLQELTAPLVGAFPDFAQEGVLRIALERPDACLPYEITVMRRPAARPSWFARWFLREKQLPASVSLTDDRLMGTAAARQYYTAAGLDIDTFSVRSYLYPRDVLASLGRDAGAAGP